MGELQGQARDDGEWTIVQDLVETARPHFMRALPPQIPNGMPRMTETLATMISAARAGTIDAGQLAQIRSFADWRAGVLLAEAESASRLEAIIWAVGVSSRLASTYPDEIFGETRTRLMKLARVSYGLEHAAPESLGHEERRRLVSKLSRYYELLPSEWRYL